MTTTMELNQFGTTDSDTELEFDYHGSVTVSRAMELLSKCGALRSRLDQILVEYVQFSLLVTGTVPSYYVKQLLQEVLRPLGETVINSVQVE